TSSPSKVRLQAASLPDTSAHPSVPPQNPLRFPSFSLFFNDTATTQIYTLSLHDALPISIRSQAASNTTSRSVRILSGNIASSQRSEEHTSELQSRSDLVCRLLLEKKK